MTDLTATNTLNLKARQLVVAPRLPAPPKQHTGNPFTSDGDIVADCAVAGCGWHAMGPRDQVKKAVDDHCRVFHSDVIGVVLLNQPGQ